MSKNKLYAVKIGRKTGVFNTWEETEKLVKCYKNASYKSFNNKLDALEFIKTVKDDINSLNIPKAYVDGSYANNKYSSGVHIVTPNNKIKEYSFSGNKREFLTARNVAGECLAALKAMEWAIKNKQSSIELIYDYIGIQKWINEWKTNEPISKFYKSEYSKKYKFLKIKFTKVKSHTGNIGNERADWLAKKALNIN
ncbi:MAG: ribonuclease H family protein [Mycoplasmoidaceae bacterium]|nr:MAG: ribonuclease H family protein [Mycoplasmoidaceae bacterium]